MRVRGIRRDQRLDAECVAESEDGADIVVLGYAVQHARDWSALLGKKSSRVGLLRRNFIALLLASGAVCWVPSQAGEWYYEQRIH